MPVKRNTIHRKLVNIVLLISGGVLLLACTTILTYEFLTFRQTTVEQASTLGRIIAANTTAALAFDNPADANAGEHGAETITLNGGQSIRPSKFC